MYHRKPTLLETVSVARSVLVKKIQRGYQSILTAVAKTLATTLSNNPDSENQVSMNLAHNAMKFKRILSKMTENGNE